MTVSVSNIWNNRAIEIEAGTAALPDSVFIASKGEHGEFCIELDRREFISAVKQELGLVDLSDEAFDNLLMSM